MPYASPADIRAALVPDPALPAGTAAELSDESLTVQIGWASAQVDAALSHRYTVPFDTAPALVADLTVAVAAYLATLLHRGGVDLPEGHPVALRYRWADNLLIKLGTGTLDLPGATSTDAPPAGPSAATVRNPYSGTLFTAADFGLGYAREADGRFGAARFYG